MPVDKIPPYELRFYDPAQGITVTPSLEDAALSIQGHPDFDAVLALLFPAPVPGEAPPFADLQEVAEKEDAEPVDSDKGSKKFG